MNEYGLFIVIQPDTWSVATVKQSVAFSVAIVIQAGTQSVLRFQFW